MLPCGVAPICHETYVNNRHRCERESTFLRFFHQQHRKKSSLHFGLNLKKGIASPWTAQINIRVVTAFTEFGIRRGIGGNKERHYNPRFHVAALPTMAIWLLGHVKDPGTREKVCAAASARTFASPTSSSSEPDADAVGAQEVQSQYTASKGYLDEFVRERKRS